MRLRTTLCFTLALALVGLLAGPSAAAETTVPSEDAYPGECAQVYILETSVGPVTVDASDSCAQVTVEEPGVATSDDKFPPTACVYPFGCT